MIGNMTTLELSEQDAQAFMLFMQHIDKIETLLDNRVFDVRNGSAEIHFNHDGEIASIDLHSKVFKRVAIAQTTVAIVKKVL